MMKAKIKKILGFESVNWTRVVMIRESKKLIEELNPRQLNVLEISGNTWRTFGFASYRSVDYPQYDICKNVLTERFTLIIAEQVFEHVAHPHLAVNNIYAMLEKGGCFYISVPFMYPVHEAPQDCARWTETGLRHLLTGGGFPEEKIVTQSWGNRGVVQRLLKGGSLTYNRYFHSLRNEPKFPVVVWGVARKD